MTISEIERAVASFKRKERRKAEFDYVMADLIGRSISRCYNSSNKMPTLAEAYPTLFNEEEEAAQIQAKKDELSVLRFKQFAQSYNKKFKH